VITVPIVLIIKSQQDASFAFVALAIILCSFLSMGLIFGPKVRVVVVYIFTNSPGPISYSRIYPQCKSE